MSKATAFSELFKAKGHGLAETDKAEDLAALPVPSRPKGKRDHRDYGKIGVYIRHETITDVKTKLIREKRELSDLVQELLEQWLSRQT